MQSLGVVDCSIRRATHACGHLCGKFLSEVDRLSISVIGLRMRGGTVPNGSIWLASLSRTAVQSSLLSAIDVSIWKDIVPLQSIECGCIYIYMYMYMYTCGNFLS